MMKFSLKGDYYLSLLTVALCFFLFVWILHLELTRNTSSHSELSYMLQKKHYKVTYLNWKGNTKEHMEEALWNLSSDNVYVLLVSFCRFHANIGLN